MNYLNEEKLHRLIGKVEKSIPYGGILPMPSDTFALHEALMILQQLVRRGIIKFDNEGFSIKRQKNEN